MSESKHTPGPWEVRQASGLRMPNRGRYIAATGASGSGPDDGFPICEWVHEEADAFLIAAAPDLLRACEGLRAAIFKIGKAAAEGEFGEGGLAALQRYVGNADDDARAALRKAGGSA